MRDQVAAGTFHAIAYAQLRRRWSDRGQRPPALVDRKVRLLAPLLAGHRSAGVQPADVATEIEWAKARLVGPAHYEAEAAAAGRKPVLTLAVMASLYERYEEEKRRRGLVDFDDLLLLCARALQTDDAFVTRSELHHELNAIRDKIDARFLALSEKIEALGTTIHARLTQLESAVARLDETGVVARTPCVSPGKAGGADLTGTRGASKPRQLPRLPGRLWYMRARVY